MQILHRAQPTKEAPTLPRGTSLLHRDGTTHRPLPIEHQHSELHLSARMSPGFCSLSKLQAGEEQRATAMCMGCFQIHLLVTLIHKSARMQMRAQDHCFPSLCSQDHKGL